MASYSRRKSSAAGPELGLPALRVKADQGNADAQFSLGLHYGSAVGEGQDFVQAAQWYRKAADQGHAEAQYNLGVMLARGQGMPQDHPKAADWTLKAAEGGNAGAQHNLGLRCHRASLDRNGPGAVESRIEAYKWFHLAAAQAYTGSLTARQRLTITMTRAEVDEGNHRATAFAVRKPLKPE